MGESIPAQRAACRASRGRPVLPTLPRSRDLARGPRGPRARPRPHHLVALPRLGGGSETSRRESANVQGVKGNERSAASVYTWLAGNERARFAEAARREGIHASQLAREAISTAIASWSADEPALLCDALHDAGRHMNDAAWAANSCARRYSHAALLSERDLDWIMDTLGTCFRCARDARKVLSDVSERALSLARRSWSVLSTRGLPSGKDGRRSLTIKMSEGERKAVREAADRLDVSVSSWVRAAILSAIDGSPATGTVIATDNEIRRLILMSIRLRANYSQTIRSLTAVREEQGTSKYLSLEEASDIIDSCHIAATAVDACWDIVVSALAPLEAKGVLRGVGICP